MRFLWAMRPLILAACALAAACASSPSPPAAAVAQEGPAPATAPAIPAAPETPEAYDDPGELHDPSVMAPLFAKDTRPSFPKATASDRDCWQAIRLSGEAKKDYESLVASCGTPTGSVPYVAPVAGKLHHVLDKRDSFDVKIQGGLCYRFFGVADATIQDLDILIERSNGRSRRRRQDQRARGDHRFGQELVHGQRRRLPVRGPDRRTRHRQLRVRRLGATEEVARARAALRSRRDRWGVARRKNR